MSARRPETKPARTIEPASKPKSTNGRAVSPYGYPFWDWVAREGPEYLAARQPLSQRSIGEAKAPSIKHREMVIIGILAFRGTKDGVVAHMRRAIGHGARREDADDDHLAVLDRQRLALADRELAQRLTGGDVLGILAGHPVPERISVGADGPPVGALRLARRLDGSCRLRLGTACAHRGLLSASADLLVHELDDDVDGAIGRRRAGLAHDEALPLPVEQLEIDHAACLAISGDEAIELRPRMPEGLGALQVEDGRKLRALALLQRAGRAALVHRGLRLPIRACAGDPPVDRQWIRLALGLDVLRVAVATDRIDDGRGDDHAAHGGANG